MPHVKHGSFPCKPRHAARFSCPMNLESPRNFQSTKHLPASHCLHEHAEHQQQPELAGWNPPARFAGHEHETLWVMCCVTHLGQCSVPRPSFPIVCRQKCNLLMQ